jgi:hypothetical protein
MYASGCTVTRPKQLLELNGSNMGWRIEICGKFCQQQNGSSYIFSVNNEEPLVQLYNLIFFPKDKFVKLSFWMPLLIGE